MEGAREITWPEWRSRGNQWRARAEVGTGRRIAHPRGGRSGRGQLTLAFTPSLIAVSAVENETFLSQMDIASDFEVIAPSLHGFVK